MIGIVGEDTRECEDRLTLEKMRNLIMQTDLCRKDKNCGGCAMVNFCAIWNYRWQDTASARFNGLYPDISAKPVKDVPFVAFKYFMNFSQKAFDKLMNYMRLNNLCFSEDYTKLKEIVRVDENNKE